MRCKLNGRLIMAIVLTFVNLNAAIATGGELGSSAPAAAPPQVTAMNTAQSAPPVTDQNNSARISVAGTMSAHNVGVDSLLRLISAVNDATSHAERVAIGKRNAALTTKYANHNVSVVGCKLLKSMVNASCYGALDGFLGGPTLIGPFNPKMMTAAYPDSSQKGNVLVVRNPNTNIARAVTITDTGPSKKLQKSPYKRAIDLTVSAFNKLGPSCMASGIMKNIEIYECPVN